MKKKPRIKDAVYERNYIYNFHYHLIWVTKYRKELFTSQNLTDETKDILSHIATLNNITIEQMEVMPDHIHLLISFKPKIAPANVVKALKGGSARLFLANHPEIKHDQFLGGHLWSHSYYMSTLGNMNKETVELYIKNQCSK